MFRQILKISWMNLLNIHTRKGISSVIVVGIGGVVAVLCSLLSMADGFAAIFTSKESNRVIVVREGSAGEMSSGVSIQEAALLETLPGAVVVSPELYMVADLAKRKTGTPANLILRGVTEDAFDVRPEVRITAGREIRSGLNEIIVGRQAFAEFSNTEVGSTLDLRDSVWTIVGHFEAGGTAVESEIWADFTSAATAFRRPGYSTVRVQTASTAEAQVFKSAVEDDPRFQHEVLTEAAFFSTQSEFLVGVIRTFTLIVGTIMAIGALFAALNTMYTAVGTRTIEIATLRALGFSRFPVICSVMLEAVILALLGGSLGAAVAWIGFNGMTVSTLNPSSFSQVAFDFVLTRETVIAGLTWAVSIGAIGGLMPAIRAATTPLTEALRGE